MQAHLYLILKCEKIATGYRDRLRTLIQNGDNAELQI